LFPLLVTLPGGVNGGDKIQVQAPDGRLNEIIVPAGFGPGSTFTVEFADEPSRTPASSSYSAPVAPATAATTSNNYNYNNKNNNTDYDDGFATGFNNPNFVPASAPATSYAATSYAAEEDVDLSAYPTATDAQPVYSNTNTYQYNTTPYVK
jgi:hypothetical protein